MELNLKYGSQKIKCMVPDSTDVLKVDEPFFNIVKKEFEDTLLKLIPSDREKIAVIISDKTRLCGYDKYLPWLLNVLKLKGYKKSNITFYIAYGTHPKQTDKECYNCYGPVYKEYKFIHHNDSDPDIMAHLAKTSFGTPVYIRKDILESDLLITFGAISLHYFAGYGGGRKLLFPGLAKRESIYFNHKLFLDVENQTLKNGCRPGNLNNNPVAEDLKELDSYLSEKISIHGLLNSRGEVCEFYFGKTYGDFLNACREYDQYFKVNNNKTYKLVLASCGGYPKDINFIQAHKSIHQAASFVKNEGTLILFAECIDGIGNDSIIPLFQIGSREKLFKKLLDKYEGNGGTALAMIAKTERIKIYLVTSMSNELCNLLGVSKIDKSNVDNILSNVIDSMAVIQSASMIFK